MDGEPIILLKLNESSYLECSAGKSLIDSNNLNSYN